MFEVGRNSVVTRREMMFPEIDGQIVHILSRPLTESRRA
jgi:hypothetical protein